MIAILLTCLTLSQDEVQTGFPGLPIGHEPRVEIHWNRFYDLEELYAQFDRLQQAWPEHLSSQRLGYSTENRELRLYVLNDPATGPPEKKPAMWIDGNVHGNEVQGGEAVLYTAWYLLENKGHNARVDELLERVVFYLVPSVNPDGRAHWFADVHSSSSARSGYMPVDDDRDGVADEDPPNDLDGDGHRTQMRKYLPGEGTHRLDPDDPRVMVRVPENDRGIRGDWVLLGREGIDDDGDGRIDEDGPGRYDMNRAWPSLWQPWHVQRGGGPYPLYWPETRAVAGFLLSHPNVAAVQSFHNAGGMILRGPGTESFGGYPAGDLRVFDQLGEEGERMLPFYRYLVLWKDLYTVFGGFATWAYEGLGVISFTNELWTGKRRFGDEERVDAAGRQWFDDHLLSGAGFVEWKPYEHPLYGAIEIGGFRKDVGRIPPSFLIEEMLHRNAMFCLAHAEACPQVLIEDPVVTDLGSGVHAIDVVFRNLRAIPTRTERASQQAIGLPDRYMLDPRRGLKLLAGGFRQDRYRPEQVELAEEEPGRLLREEGLVKGDEVRVRWFVRGTGRAVILWQGEKARDVHAVVDIE